MFGRKKHQAPKELLEKLRANPGALASMRQAFLTQVLATFGMKAYDWIAEKPGRKFVLEHDADGALSFSFLENGEEATPGFFRE